jgi:hypothetical protein
VANDTRSLEIATSLAASQQALAKQLADLQVRPVKQVPGARIDFFGGSESSSLSTRDLVTESSIRFLACRNSIPGNHFEWFGLWLVQGRKGYSGEVLMLREGLIVVK